MTMTKMHKLRIQKTSASKRCTARLLPSCVAMAWVLGAGAMAAQAAVPVETDPVWYQRQQTWEETVRLSREALFRCEAEEAAALALKQATNPAVKAFQPVKVTVDSEQKPVKVRIRVAGLDQLSIISWIEKGRPQGVEGVLGEPCLITADGKRVECRNEMAGLANFPAGRRYPFEGSPTIVGRKLEYGFWCPYDNEIRLPLEGKYEWFEAWMGARKGEGLKREFEFNCQGRYEGTSVRGQRRQQIWSLIRRDFPSGPIEAMPDPSGLWNVDWVPGNLSGLAQRYVEASAGGFQAEARTLAKNVQTPQDLEKVREYYRLSLRSRKLAAQIKAVNFEAARRAIDDLGKTYPEKYAAAEHRKAVDLFEKRKDELLIGLAAGNKEALAEAEQVFGAVRGALLANPLLDFDKLLVVRRDRTSDAMLDTGFIQYNFWSHASVYLRSGWENEIAVLSDLRGQPKLERLYKPTKGQIVRDVHLDFDARSLIFSSFDDKGRWAVYEVRTDGTGLKQLTPTNYPDVDFFDPCRLPNGKLIVASTANYYGLPCTGGGDQIASLYLLDPVTQALRQLTFDQDSDSYPAVLNDGRVLYQRWEYSDIPHYFSRRRMVMNPDGTGQVALHGSNGMFPTSLLYTRPVPDHPTRLVGILTGHHDFGECGRMVVLDPGMAAGYPFRYRPTSKEWGEEGKQIIVTPEVLPAEQTGFLQLVPGWGKPVAGIVCDNPVAAYYRKENPVLTVQPHPLSSKYFLVSQRPSDSSPWSIYLVDIFDNATLIAELDGSSLFEPAPLVARPLPPVIPDRVKPGSKTATVHIASLYNTPGLQGVPPGTVKALRIFSYHFGYFGKAGVDHCGVNSSWDVKRVLGTARVEADGSAHFQIPANTPVSLQPLDGEGRAMQLMRSWLVGMPGETVSCVGCHESRLTTLPTQYSQATQRVAEPLTPWGGSPMPFGFTTGVYPVLEQYCIGCHQDAPQTGGPRSKPSFANPRSAYDTLHPYIHRPGPESDMALHRPMEYHASTSPLIQLLEKGHHGLRLAAMAREARERLYCWIDLNAPFNDAWAPGKWKERRYELAKEFGNVEDDPEREAQTRLEAFNKRTPVAFATPPPEPAVLPDELKADGFPMDAPAASARQQAAGGADKTLELGGGVTLALKRIPAGEFVMGDLAGPSDERPRARVRVSRPFWLGATEVSNAQYAQFDPAHDTRYVDMYWMDRVTPGYIANHPNQPVARISWQEAMRFCAWLSQKSGLKVTLPTEAQWEWAARAGTGSQFFYGDLNADFSPFANLADQSMRWNKVYFPGAGVLQPRTPYPPQMNFPLHDERFKDKWHVVDYVGQCQANAWGLKDMVGNVSEWTCSSYRPYPYVESDSRNDGSLSERKVARGGSWADRPADAGSSVRYPYESWQKVYNVGFRILVEEAGGPGK
ncbi:MAG: SUMF1/EgtB/PvdO family nonheme iron enzyme [bacterium]